MIELPVWAFALVAGLALGNAVAAFYFAQKYRKVVYHNEEMATTLIGVAYEWNHDYQDLHHGHMRGHELNEDGTDAKEVLFPDDG